MRAMRPFWVDIFNPARARVIGTGPHKNNPDMSINLRAEIAGRSESVVDLWTYIQDGKKMVSISFGNGVLMENGKNCYTLIVDNE